MPNETVWCVPPEFSLAWRYWDGEYIVYNSASGQTHHLNFVAGEALKSLEKAPASGPEIKDRLADQLGLAPDDDAVVDISELADHFDELGLVAPVGL